MKPLGQRITLSKISQNEDQNFDLESELVEDRQSEQSSIEDAINHWITLRKIIHSLEGYNRPFEQIVQNEEYEGICAKDFYIHFKPIYTYSAYDKNASYLYIVKSSYSGVNYAQILSGEIKLSSKYSKSSSIRKDTVYNLYFDVLVPNMVIEMDFYILPRVDEFTVNSEKKRMKPGNFRIVLTNVEINVAAELTKKDEAFIRTNLFTNMKEYFRNLYLDLEYTVEKIEIIDEITVPERRDGIFSFKLDKRYIDQRNIPSLVKNIINELSDNVSTEYYNLKQRLIEAITPKVLEMPSITRIPDIIKNFFCYGLTDDPSSPSNQETSSNTDDANDLISYFATDMLELSSAISYIEEKLCKNQDGQICDWDRHAIGLLREQVNDDRVSFEKWNELVDPPKWMGDDAASVDKEIDIDEFKWDYYTREEDILEMAGIDLLSKPSKYQEFFGDKIKPYTRSWVNDLWKVLPLFDGFKKYQNHVMDNMIWQDRIHRTDILEENYNGQENIFYSGFASSNIEMSLNALNAQESREPLPSPGDPDKKYIRSDIEFTINVKITIPRIVAKMDYNVESKIDAQTEEETLPGHIILKVEDLVIEAACVIRQIDPKFVHRIADTEKFFHFRMPDITKLAYKVGRIETIENIPPRSGKETENPDFLTPNLSQKDAADFIASKIENYANPTEELLNWQADYLKNKLAANIIPMPSIYNIVDVIKFTLDNNPEKNIAYKYTTTEQQQQGRKLLVDPVRSGATALKYIKRTLRGKRKFLSFRDILALRQATEYVDKSEGREGFISVMMEFQKVLEDYP